ncbi:maleate cis-trans isomerase family protein [Halostreptopolyspora alba]|uniref:Maleate isomerase n=1 Tax=Halostreptopolyspora alba TaxID=2487137 RepID=A0A3N0EDL5_9ACTN|nr:Asp/Glu racemase [Nocardiopsaceae bacterium YIM 96095]
MPDYRIGMIVPSSNVTMETEVPRMLRAREAVIPDERFTFHSARARMRQVTPEQLREMNAQSEDAAVALSDSRPDIVATACLVAIMAQGPGFHCTAEDTIAAALRKNTADAPVVSSAGALLKALSALGTRRVAILTPYMRSLTTTVVNYIEDAGIEVVDALSLEVSDNLEVANLDPSGLEEHWRTLDLSGADALVISACVQMPSLRVIQRIEDRAPVPVLSAATATVHSLLSELGLRTAVPEAGYLLSGQVPAP